MACWGDIGQGLPGGHPRLGHFEAERSRSGLDPRSFQTVSQKVSDIALKAGLAADEIYHSVLDVLVGEVMHNAVPQ